MNNLLHELLLSTADRMPERIALAFKKDQVNYGELAAMVRRAAAGLRAQGLTRRDRVAVYLPKQPETVAAMFAAAAAGGAFVPVNPLLKADQVEHILRDCNVRFLVTSQDRLEALRGILKNCPDLKCAIVLEDSQRAEDNTGLTCLSWTDLLSNDGALPATNTIDTDLTSIFYTSGSTGKPKGVVLSHRNMVAGAQSVAEYLCNTQDDKLLAVLPFSFDYGFSQLSTAFHVGASVTLMDYLFPRDVIVAVEKYAITGLAGVPPLWIQLAKLPWPEAAAKTLRYITNSGGAMPTNTLQLLRDALPSTDPYLMYGLTEAFRSTYLPPDQIDARPESMGKAIPNAEVLVVREDGTACGPDEPGELVHRGALVSLGYWNDPERTAIRFRPAPAQPGELPNEELAVWSGDTVRADADGYLYFVGRRDEMIKTSGYRVSPNEVEEALYATGLVAEAIAVGVPHPDLGQVIAIVAVAAAGKLSSDTNDTLTSQLLAECRQQLPSYMIPARIEWRAKLPRNANGKIDRSLLKNELLAGADSN